MALEKASVPEETTNQSRSLMPGAQLQKLNLCRHPRQNAPKTRSTLDKL